MSHYSPIVAALITMLLTIVILLSKFGKEIQDIPNERSLHETPFRVSVVWADGRLIVGMGVDAHFSRVVVGVAFNRIVHRLLRDDMHGLSVGQRLSTHLWRQRFWLWGPGC